MTVKSLTEEQKDRIVTMFTAKYYTLAELAIAYNRSPRTIIRALEERDAAPVVRRRNRKPKVVLLPAATPTKAPRWWTRFIDWAFPIIANNHTCQ